MARLLYSGALYSFPQNVMWLMLFCPVFVMVPLHSTLNMLLFERGSFSLRAESK